MNYLTKYTNEVREGRGDTERNLNQFQDEMESE